MHRWIRYWVFAGDSRGWLRHCPWQSPCQCHDRTAGWQACRTCQDSRSASSSDRNKATALSIHPPSAIRSEEHTSELQSLMRISYAVFCLKKKITTKIYPILFSTSQYKYVQYKTTYITF